jgi:phenylacetate-CoA ligase
MTRHPSPLGRIRGNIGAIQWPPISTGNAAVLAAFVRQLEDTQWASAEEIARRQGEQLVVLAQHCAKHSKQFRARLARAKLKPDDLAGADGLARLPVLTRRQLQTAPGELYCAEVPADHLPTHENRTSGATGEPVAVRRTAVTQLIWLAMAMRDHLWHRRDFGGRMASIRATIVKEERHPDWGPPANLLFRTGTALAIPGRTDLGLIADSLRQFRPDNILIYPSVLDALTQHYRDRDVTLSNLHHIRTVGETLSLHIRRDATAHFGAKVEDSYTSEELGYIALECPESGLYHVMSESVIVEVVDDRGQACAEGEIGRVAVTDLHNFATPLIRYDIGDYAEIGGACACGRGLPTLKRILGRERNLIQMPDGRRFWPRTGDWGFHEIAPVSQYQLIQIERERIEVRVVAERPLTAAQEADLSVLIQRALHHPFALQFAYFDERLPVGANGKFEEFVCRIETA